MKADIDLDGMLEDLESNPLQNAPRNALPTRGHSLSKYSSLDSAFSHPRPASEEVLEHMDVVANENAADADDGDHYPAFESSYLEPETVDENVDAENQTAVPIKEEKKELEAPKVLSMREKLFQKAKETTRVSKAARDALEQSKIQKTVDMNGDIDGEHVPNRSTPAVKPVPSNEVAEWWSGTDGATTGAADDEYTLLDPEAAADIYTSEPSGEAGTIRMFWTDAVEIRDRPGKIYLIGKMRTEKSEFVSCCVAVENLNRYLYVVPKVPEGKAEVAQMTKDERNELWLSMHQELQRILIPTCISDPRDQSCFGTKLVDRNYAFELPDMPRGISQYLKLKYPAKYPMPPLDYCEHGGKTFTRICGRSSRPVESFLVRRKLLGPGWIEISDAQCVKKIPASYCKAEYVTLSPKNVTSVQGIPPPPLTVMSIALKTYSHPETHKHEVVAISCIVQSNVNCEGATKDMKSFSHFTLVRPIDPNSRGFPPDYSVAIAHDPRFASKETFRMELNERALLNYFLNRVQKYDPDILTGHNIHKYGMDVLMTRCDAHNLGGAWSRMTRLRRGRINPYKVGDGWSEYSMDDVSNGRLIVDTFVGAKELLGSQPTYSLTYLIESQLKHKRQEVDVVDIPRILESGSDAFVNLCRHTSDDALFMLHLMHKLEILPLSKQLANLCGYFWSRTLEGNKRAERIEYLLLHEFDRAKPKFIVPDKALFADKSRKGTTTKRAPAYAGGMVFAPKKGLYDNFVVLLDFNSLYPSIIREYNICFTTVDRLHLDEADHDSVPELPCAGLDEGILPNVIKRLLESRKQVKKELKKEQMNGNAEKATRLDIRQKAIKLTANSMYGCLGFQHSRFYAKPIAALITHTGRTTLQRAQHVAEDECGYTVVYGDTDSIMVDSKSTDLTDAKRIGREIQLKCNKKFRLLELEVDYIFKRILLLNKKKYAAIVVHEDSKSGNVTYSTEVKGLDMVRRDWCNLSKTVGHQVLDYILSGDSREDAVEQIHTYLEGIAERVRSNTEPINAFIITKSLNKAPEKYPDRSKQYHVQVALALKAQGQPIGVGVHIPYVICNEHEANTDRRAYHPDEVEKANGTLTIDTEWYLETQIHPPVNRLCAHIDGTSSPQLAHMLGLSASKFSHAKQLGRQDDDDENICIPSVLQCDSDRFDHCVKLVVCCQSCNASSAFPGIFQDVTLMESKSGLHCPNCDAAYWGMAAKGINDQEGDNLLGWMSNELALRVRECTKAYYESWLICTDLTCKHRTQQQALTDLSGKACTALHCRGQVRMEYTDHDLYSQLKYFQSLFDVERAKDKCNKGQVIAKLPPLTVWEAQLYETLYKQMELAIRRNEYNWVQPSMWTHLFK